MPIVRKPGTSAAEFETLIEKYKIQNPVKYQMKKEALEKKLASLKAAEGIEVEVEKKSKK